VYQRRLHSNLVFEFRSLIGERAPDVARRIAGLIDGLYLRYALDENVQDGREAVVHILRAFDAECREIQENEDSSAVGVDPSPMDPISKPQE
jgi:TetR/AcrR family transcriptional repressor of bet genes